MTRGEAVADAARRLREAGIPPRDARAEATTLLRHAALVTREELFLRPEVPLTEPDALHYETLIARRARREPLAYITGTREFYGLSLTVTPDVLIPRPETEGVVEAVIAAEREEGVGADFSVLDLCTGSGAIAVAVAVRLPEARIVATDLSETALVVAAANARRHGVADRVTLLAGDLFAPVPTGMRFTVVAANPPYIAPVEIEELEPEVRDFEPRLALGVHTDALHFYRRIAAESRGYLRDGGRAVVEVGRGQAEAVTGFFRSAGFAEVDVIPDLAGIDRVVVACASCSSL